MPADDYRPEEEADTDDEGSSHEQTPAAYLQGAFCSILQFQQ